MGKMSNEDKETIRSLAELLDETGLTEIEVRSFPGRRIRVSRQATAAAAAPAAAPASSPAPEKSGGEENGEKQPASPEDYSSHPGTVKSPMVGTVYLAPEPGADNFVSEGDTVTQGQTLVIVEAMKTMNPIPAPKGGKITAILVENEQPVEYGAPLVVVE